MIVAVSAVEETVPCYRHPRAETALHCSACDRPICTECAVAAPVGIKCPECARLPRTARAGVPTPRLLMGAAAGLVCAVAITLLLLAGLRVGFLFLLLAWLAGMGIAEIVRRATGGFRERQVALIAASSAALAFLGAPIIELMQGAPPGGGSLILLVAAVLAAVGAYQRI